MGYLFKNDRELSTEKIEEQRRHWVVEHNDLITQASHDLTAKELKIMDFVISKIKPNDTEFNTINTSLYELNKVLNLNVRSGANYNQMALNLKELREKTVTIYKDSNKRSVIFTGWLQDVEVVENGQVELKLSEKLMPFFLQLRGDYTQYKLFDTVKLSSKYSIQLYKIMREADKNRGQKTPYIHISPEKLAEMLGSPESYTFGQFNQNVLQPAVDEINLKIDDMDLVAHQFRQGRRVVELEIYNNFYPIETVALPEDFEHVPMDIDKYE